MLYAYFNGTKMFFPFRFSPTITRYLSHIIIMMTSPYSYRCYYYWVYYAYIIRMMFVKTERNPLLDPPICDGLQHCSVGAIFWTVNTSQCLEKSKLKTWRNEVCFHQLKSFLFTFLNDFNHTFSISTWSPLSQNIRRG